MNTRNLCIVALALALSACQGVKEQLGVGRHSPDEFTVVKRAPLTLPPDMSLPAPVDNIVPPPSQAAAQARAALLGTAAEAADSNDGALLEKIGADVANPDIRYVINRENGHIALENTSVADKLIFWKEETEDDKIPSSVVDPKAEAERLKKALEAGAPVNEGDVPVIEKKQSTIDKLF